MSLNQDFELDEEIEIELGELGKTFEVDGTHKHQHNQFISKEFDDLFEEALKENNNNTKIVEESIKENLQQKEEIIPKIKEESSILPPKPPVVVFEVHQETVDLVEVDELERAKKQWDDIQNLREKQQYGIHSGQISTVDSTELPMKFTEALDYYQNLDLPKEREMANEKYNAYNEDISFFQKLFSCFESKNEDLEDEIIFILSISLIPLDHSKVEHERQMFTLYRKITGDKNICPSIGSHWESIGFQGSDPKTDLRGVGMFGILQLLYLVQEDEKLATDLFVLSNTQTFPLAVVSLNMTQILLTMLLEGKLNNLAKGKSLLRVMNDGYLSVFYKFYCTWKNGQKNIRDYDQVKKDLKSEVTKSLDTIITHYKKVKEELKPKAAKEESNFDLH